MDDDVRILFREVADLSVCQRESYYSRRHVPARVRAEVESLLSFDAATRDSLGRLVESVARRLRRSYLLRT
jgi:hypothetical protein